MNYNVIQNAITKQTQEQFTIGTNSVLASSITDQIKALWDAINS